MTVTLDPAKLKEIADAASANHAAGDWVVVPDLETPPPDEPIGKAFDPKELRDLHGRWTRTPGVHYPPSVIAHAEADPDPQSRTLALDLLRAEEVVRRLEQHRDHQPKPHRQFFQERVDAAQEKVREAYDKWVARQVELGRSPAKGGR